MIFTKALKYWENRVVSNDKKIMKNLFNDNQKNNGFNNA